MQVVKGKKKKEPSKIRLSEEEIVEACYQFLKSKNYNLTGTATLIIPKGESKRRRQIRFYADLDDSE